MANVKIKEKALFLRNNGKSLSEISNKINVPKSTVSIWCRNVRLTDKQIERLNKKQESGSYIGRMRFLEKVKAERMTQTKKLKEDGLKQVGDINKRDLFIAGIALYLSEGATSECNEEVSFTNSDHRTILFMLKWFEDICKVSKERFVIQVRVNKIHKERTLEIEKYWSKITKIPLGQFTKTILIKSKIKKEYPKSNIYFGTVRLKVHKATQLRRRINGWVDGLLK